MPSGKYADIADVVGTTLTKHVESDIRKNVEFAPESETAVQEDKGVLRDKGETIRSVELRKTAEIMLSDEGSLNTRSSYLGRTHLDVFPPNGLDAVAASTWPGAGLLQVALVWPQTP